MADVSFCLHVRVCNAQAPPANNFKFGDYSFAMEVLDDSGNVEAGYAFEEPVVIR